MTVAGFRLSRDAFGIPTVTADSVDGVFRGQGYATAEDRLWQMEWDRRRSLGRTAELVASAANVVTDCFFRRVRLADTARAGFAGLDSATQEVCAAFVEGVNRWQDEMTSLPIEFDALGVAPEPWEPWHPIAVFLTRHLNFATWQDTLWNARVAASLGAESLGLFRDEGQTGTTPVIVPPDVVDAIEALADPAFGVGASATWLADLAPLGLGVSGSNAWVVDGSRTASGMPIVAGDPHRALEVPNVYYQARLRGPDIDVDGLCFVGVPGVQHFGQTTRVAWGVTNAMAGYQDLFVERLPDALADTRDETVDVRGGDSVTVECSLTRHGPIVVGSRDAGVGLALASTGLVEAGGSLRTILPFLRAASVAEFDAALADWVEPVNNFVFADVEGKVGYHMAGRVPRRDVRNLSLPVPGWDAAFDWDGTVPFAELPAVRRPAGGAVVTANQRVAPAAIAVRLSADYASPQRAERIWARLDDTSTVADHEGVHADDVWRSGQRLAARMVACGHPGADLVLGWDGRMDAHSRAATLVAVTMHHLCRALVAALPGSLRDNPFARWEPPATATPPVMRVSNAIGGWLVLDAVPLPGGGAWEPWVRGAFDAAVAELGEPVPEWATLHTAAPRHGVAGADSALDAVTAVPSPGLAGGAGCVLATVQVPGISHRAVLGSTARYVWDLADRRNSRWIVPLGASGDPRSPHFTDQQSRWAVCATIPVLD